MPIFLDTETTGLGKCRLVELCYWVEGEEEPVVLRCKPAIPMGEEAIAIHGITEEEVANLPLFQDLPEYPQIKKLLEGRVIVAHNAPFDVGVLEREGIIVKESVCTKKMAKARWPQASSHSLQKLREWLPLDVVESAPAHSALGDVLVLRALWNRLSN